MPAAPCLSPAIEVVYHALPDRLNEDTWLVMQAGPLGERIVFAAIDGATTRLTPPALQRYLDSHAMPLTPAAFSARVVRDALARHIAEGMFPDLRTLLLEANADLGRALIGIFGALSLEGMEFPPEVYATLRNDPRLVRLGLPASVITLAEYDPAARTIRFAHAGDTLLLVAYQDGRVAVPTHPDDPADSALKHAARQLRQIHPHLPFRELIRQPEVRKLNLNSGLRHNYVDEHGLPQPTQGIGVMDGLPELRYFIKTGKIAADDVAFVCAMTDGLEWHPSAGEVFAEHPDEAAELMQQRRAFMVDQIDRLGLAGYLELLRQAEAEDADHEQFPRMKTHDDATGVLLRFA
ncbi:MAG: hypothetical protein GXY36_02980 [Chloroflexi bacterium]|nr:hypothetical protein [Chloroflexota bacterium]